MFEIQNSASFTQANHNALTWLKWTQPNKTSYELGSSPVFPLFRSYSQFTFKALKFMKFWCKVFEGSLKINLATKNSHDMHSNVYTSILSKFSSINSNEIYQGSTWFEILSKRTCKCSSVTRANSWCQIRCSVNWNPLWLHSKEFNFYLKFSNFSTKW